MKKIYPVVLLSFFYVLLMGLSSSVYSDGGLDTRMDAYLVTVNKKGKEKIKPTKTAEPGQIIEYRIVHKNTSKGDLKNLTTNGPVPQNTTYIEKSAKTKVKHNFLVSIDNGVTYQKEPVKRIFTDAAGKKREEIVPPSEYTHLRWNGKEKIKKGKKQQYVYRVVVR